MPKQTKTEPHGGISHADLNYAVGQLVKLGRTTTEEILKLAGERERRIHDLAAELAALRQGLLPPGDLVAKKPAATKAKPKKGSAAAAKPKKVAAKKTPNAPKAAPARKAVKGKRVAAKVGKIITRKDGRTFTTTAKVVKARRIQGQYIAYLRKVDPNEREGFRAIAKEQGVPAAVEAMRKRVG